MHSYTGRLILEHAFIGGSARMEEYHEYLLTK